MHTKIRVDAIFHMRDVRGKVLPRFIELCMGTLCLCPSEGYQRNMAAGKQRKYLLPSFATSVISSLEELISIKVILFLRTVQIAILPN